jgi:hypothetical protein
MQTAALHARCNILGHGIVRCHVITGPAQSSVRCNYLCSTDATFQVGLSRLCRGCRHAHAARHGAAHAGAAAATGLARGAAAAARDAAHGTAAARVRHAATSGSARRLFVCACRLNIRTCVATCKRSDAAAQVAAPAAAAWCTTPPRAAARQRHAARPPAAHAAPAAPGQPAELPRGSGDGHPLPAGHSPARGCLSASWLHPCASRHKSQLLAG